MRRMPMGSRPIALLCSGLLLLAAPLPIGAEPPAATAMPDAARLETMAARFAPVDITADASRLPANEREALGKIVAAARFMDPLFLRQVWAGNESLLLALLEDNSPLGRARLRYFLINKGPWSRLDEEAPF